MAAASCTSCTSWQEVRDSEIERLESSGWQTNGPLRELVDRAGLLPPGRVAAAGLNESGWARVAQLVSGLQERFGACRFAEEADYGLLAVPDPERLDTRGALPRPVREGQHPGLGEDFVDPELGPGADVSHEAADVEGWRLFVAMVGVRGISVGSYEQIVAAPVEDFEVEGLDTRRFMTRQLWGARLLQSSPGQVPDSDLSRPWAFTLLPGEGLVGGRAVSGTVLKGRVRFRLGRADRGIGSARVSPALPVRVTA